MREQDGLALSSRNRLLSPDQRAAAPVLYRALQAAAAQLNNGERQATALREAALQKFQNTPSVELEYLDFVDPETLTPLEQVRHRLLIAGAIRLDTVRLIDNITWSAPA